MMTIKRKLPCVLLPTIFVGSLLVFLHAFSRSTNQAGVDILKQWFFYNSISNGGSQTVAMVPGSKWIVVTSVQPPTEDIKNLASQPGWTLVVVADTKTPSNWAYPGVHFLSLEKQEELFESFAKLLPTKSYTRKNLGYLYALTNGAEWIYDTDDDNKPYGRGLSQLDYTSPISGLRYVSTSKNISEKLFNPYRFYGFDNMWPRGFPLEHLEGHTNGKDRMVSCRELPLPIVQQGVVKADPDVDAIYRLLYAEKATGLNVTFNNIAPPIHLDTGTYSPWNSQNTLFHYKAFFIMYLPTTVAFRVTDIWRSYFGQKLLHLIGEHIAFYPTNAVQHRNAHNYLSDFHQEIDVYEQSGKIVEFLDGWSCLHNSTVKCVLELADKFVENKFFGKSDRDLIKAWLDQLTRFGYNFPPLAKGNAPLMLGQKFGNCRATNLDLGTSKYRLKGDEAAVWATETVKGFGELLNWCEGSDGDNGTFIPTDRQFQQRLGNLTGLQQKNNTVLILVSNSNWRSSIIGLLQRLYSPFFKTTVFCGTWADPWQGPGDLPPLEPLNFVNITPEEMRDGYSYGYCISKVKDLNLQDVAGYYFIADDATFNIWHNLPLDKVVNPEEIVEEKYWWHPEEVLRAYNLLENKYKDDPKFGKSWKEYKELVLKTYPETNVTERFLNVSMKLVSDLVYIPSSAMEYIGNLMEVMVEAEVFVEIAFGKIFDCLNHNRGGSFKYLWLERAEQWSLYNSSNIGIHPIKLGQITADLSLRRQYCNTVVKAFGHEIYGQSN